MAVPEARETLLVGEGHARPRGACLEAERPGAGPHARGEQETPPGGGWPKESHGPGGTLPRRDYL